MSEPHGAIVAPTAHSLGHVQNLLNGITTRQLLNTTPMLPSMPSRSTSVRHRPSQSDRKKSDNVLYTSTARQKSNSSIHSLLTDSNRAVNAQTSSIRFLDGYNMRGDTSQSTHRGKYTVIGSNHILHETSGQNGSFHKTNILDLKSSDNESVSNQIYDPVLSTNLGSSMGGVHTDSYWRVHQQEQVDTQLTDKERLDMENSILRSQLTNRTGNDSARLQELLDQSLNRQNTLECGEERYLAERQMLLSEIDENMYALQEMSTKVTSNEQELVFLRNEQNVNTSELQKHMELNQRLEVENRLLSVSSKTMQENMQQHIKKKNELLKTQEEHDQLIRTLNSQNTEQTQNYQALQENMRETTTKLHESEKQAKEAMATCMALKEQLDETSKVKGDVAVETNNLIIDQRKDCHSFLQAASDAQEQLLAAKREAIREQEDNQAKVDHIKEKLLRQEMKYTELQGKLDESKRVVDALTETQRKIYEELGEVKNQLKLEQEARQRVEEEHKQTQDQLTKLDDKHKETLKRLAAVNAKLEKAEQSRKQLALLKSNAEDKAKSLELQLDMRNKEFARLLKELDDVKTKYRLLSEQHQQCDYKIQALKEQAQSQMDILNRELHQRQAVTQALTKSLEQQRLKSVENERIYTEHMNRMQEEKRKNDDTMHRLITAAKRMQRRGEEYDNMIKTKQNELNRLDEKLRSNQKELVTMRGDYEKCKNEQSSAKERIRGLEYRGSSTPTSPSGDSDHLSRRLTTQNAEQRQDLSRLRNVAVLAEEAHKHCANNIRKLQTHVRQYNEYVSKNNLTALVMEEEEDVWSPRERVLSMEPPSPGQSPGSASRHTHFFPSNQQYPATPSSKRRSKRDNKLTPWQEQDVEAVDEDATSNPNLQGQYNNKFTPSPSQHNSPSQQSIPGALTPRNSMSEKRPQTGTSKKQDPLKSKPSNIGSGNLTKKDSSGSLSTGASRPGSALTMTPLASTRHAATLDAGDRPSSAQSQAGSTLTSPKVFTDSTDMLDLKNKLERLESVILTKEKDIEEVQSVNMSLTHELKQYKSESFMYRAYNSQSPGADPSPDVNGKTIGNAPAANFQNVLVAPASFSPEQMLPFTVVDKKGIVAVATMSSSGNEQHLLKPGSLLLYVNGKYVRDAKDVYDAVEYTDGAVLLGFVQPPNSIKSAVDQLAQVDVTPAKTSYHTVVLDLALGRDTVIPFKDITHARVPLVKSAPQVVISDRDPSSPDLSSLVINTDMAVYNKPLPQLSSNIVQVPSVKHINDDTYQRNLLPLRSYLTVNVNIDEPNSKAQNSNRENSLSTSSHMSNISNMFEISIDGVEEYRGEDSLR